MCGLFPGRNSPNIANMNPAIPGKERGDRVLILTYLDGPMTEVFTRYCLSYLILTIFREERVVKVGLKVQTLGPSLFYENSNPSNFFQAMSLLARVLPLVRISVIMDHIWGSKGSKSSQKGRFHGCWIGTQNFENLKPQMPFSWNLPRLCIFMRV